MMCWPKRRRPMPARPSSGFAATTPKMLRSTGIGVHAEQQVGRGEIEEAEGVRLHDLREVQHARAACAAVGGMRTDMMASQALAEAIRWLTGQMPQMRAMRRGIS